MNAGVALARSYLHLNGYFTTSEMPVIRGRQGGAYQEVTDLDILGVRFPGARHVVPRGRPGPEDDLRLAVDEVLAPDRTAVDVVIAEVKEGKARLNDAVRTHDVLYTALSRVGCVPADRMEDVIADLRGAGEARLGRDDSPIPCRVRLVAFGNGSSGRRDGYRVLSLEHVAGFVEDHLERYHEILQPADVRDPVLGLLHLLRKLR